MTNESGKKPVLHKKHVARQQREQQQTRLILYVFFGILGGVILLLVYGWLDINYLQAQKPVAKVGETEILVKDFEPRVRLQRQNLLGQHVQFQQYAQYFGMDVTSQLQQIESQLNSPEIIGQTVLDLMINEEIIRQEAAKRGITVSEEELQEELQGAFNYFPNGTPSPTITPTQAVMPELPAEALKIVTPTLLPTATLEATATLQPVKSTPAEGVTVTIEPTITPTVTIAPSATPTVGPTSTPLPTATPYTEEGFQDTLIEVDTNLSKLGFSEEYYRTFFESQILERKLREQILTDVPSTETQVWARHILVPDEETAKSVITRFQAGEDFAELAKELSTDTASAVQGGDLGWFGSGAMVAEFETAAFALENSGDITTTPVQSSFGFHIIQLVTKQERPLTADQYQTAKDTAFQEWLTTAREEYAVEIFDVWKQRVPTEPNFITAATEAAIAQQTSQAEILSTFEATTLTPIP